MCVLMKRDTEKLDWDWTIIGIWLATILRLMSGKIRLPVNTYATIRQVKFNWHWQPLFGISNRSKPSRIFQMLTLHFQASRCSFKDVTSQLDTIIFKKCLKHSFFLSIQKRMIEPLLYTRPWPWHCSTKVKRQSGCSACLGGAYHLMGNRDLRTGK